MVDWIQAIRIGGIGFVTVIAVLGILSLVLWLVSLLIYRILHRKSKAATQEGK